MKKNAFALVELIVALGVFSIIIFGAIRLFITVQETSIIGQKKTQAQALLAEYLAYLHNLRADDWENLTNGRWLVQESGGNLSLSPTTDGETINGFTRYLEIEDAFRDQAGQLVASGGFPDPSTKKISVTVSWSGIFPGSSTQSTYLTRYRQNLAWTQTTITDFSAGTMEYLEIVEPIIDNGEVQLQGGCLENPVGAWIYDDQFQNSWTIHPSAKESIKEVSQPPGFVYQGAKALEIANFSGSNTKLRNTGNVCTLGFTRIEFWAYNSAAINQSFQIGGKWDQEFVEVLLPSRSWRFISLSYGDVSGGQEVNFNFIFFRAGSQYQSDTKFYLDNMTLAGGIGGYYQVGTLTSSTLDANYQSAFNRISFNGLMPANTQIGIQTAVADSPAGPWIFYGPGGTSLPDDLYLNPEGEGIWLGANIGRYFKYKAYLKSLDGQETPVLYDVTVNYSP